MKAFQTIILASILGLLNACSTSSTSPLTVEESDAVKAAQRIVQSEYAYDAVFQEAGLIVEPTEVENRYKILQRFDSEIKDGYNFVYRIWVQKFPTGWEFGNLGIERAGGERVLTTNGRMKEMELLEGVGNTITAGGITFNIAEQKGSNVIRVYTDAKLSRSELRAAISDLMGEYEQIQFATSAKHERGDEYAGWLNDMFFDYEKDEILGKKKFFN